MQGEFFFFTELVTVPAEVFELWANTNFPLPNKQFRYKAAA
jgi:hypothetical protein